MDIEDENNSNNNTSNLSTPPPLPSQQPQQPRGPPPLEKTPKLTNGGMLNGNGPTPPAPNTTNTTNNTTTNTTTTNTTANTTTATLSPQQPLGTTMPEEKKHTVAPPCTTTLNNLIDGAMTKYEMVFNEVIHETKFCQLLMSHTLGSIAEIDALKYFNRITTKMLQSNQHTVTSWDDFLKVIEGLLIFTIMNAHGRINGMTENKEHVLFQHTKKLAGDFLKGVPLSAEQNDQLEKLFETVKKTHTQIKSLDRLEEPQLSNSLIPNNLEQALIFNSMLRGMLGSLGDGGGGGGGGGSGGGGGISF